MSVDAWLTSQNRRKLLETRHSDDLTAVQGLPHPREQSFRAELTIRVSVR